MSEEQVTGSGPVGVKEWSGERRRWLPKDGSSSATLNGIVFIMANIYWALTMC